MCFSFPGTGSFSDVHPLDVAVQDLKVEVEVTTLFADALKVKFTGLEVGDAEGGA